MRTLVFGALTSAVAAQCQEMRHFVAVILSKQLSYISA